MKNMNGKFFPETLEEEIDEIELQLQTQRPDVEQWAINEVIRQLKRSYKFETGERRNIPHYLADALRRLEGIGIPE